MCERDVGLFSLIQQAIANVPWALKEGRVPVAYFGRRTCYWTPSGYQGGDTVWEYYFEPIVPTHCVSIIPQHIRAIISRRHPSPFEVGYPLEEGTFVSAHFGDHPALQGKALAIPYRFEDPGPALRRRTEAIIRDFVRPRGYIQDRVELFESECMSGRYVIGVHIRGTDAASPAEIRPHRQGSLRLTRYAEELNRLLQSEPEALIFVATDDQASLDFVKRSFGDRVLKYDAIRHEAGPTAGTGPTGWIMPAYIAVDRDRAARNGAEAVIEYLLLARCNHLIHNGSSLARTVLLKAPAMPHTNIHNRCP